MNWWEENLERWALAVYKNQKLLRSLLLHTHVTTTFLLKRINIVKLVSTFTVYDRTWHPSRIAVPWWHHQMETFSALLAICAGNSPVNSAHKGQWHGDVMFSLICVWINGWVNNGEPGDLRRHGAHYNVTVMTTQRFIRSSALTPPNSSLGQARPKHELLILWPIASLSHQQLLCWKWETWCWLKWVSISTTAAISKKEVVWNKNNSIILLSKKSAVKKLIYRINLTMQVMK